MKFLTLGLFLLSFAAAGGATEDPPYVIATIPDNKCIMFDGEINGKPLKIFLDTGGPESKVWKKTAARLGMPAQGGTFDVKVGDVVVKGLPLRIDQVDNGYTAYGMEAFFGATFAKKLFTIVDYPSNRVLFVPCGGTTTYADAAKIADAKLRELEKDVVVPFTSPTGHIYVETIVNGTEKMQFIVDTGGMSGNVLTGIAVKKFGIKFTKDTSETAPLEIAVAGHDFKKVTFRNIMIPALEQTVPSLQKQGIFLAGILGADFLRNYRIGIDYADKKLHIGLRKQTDEDVALEQARVRFEECSRLLTDKKYAESIEGFVKIADQFPKHSLGVTAAYNVACAYALSGDKGKALDWLEKAVANGYNDFAHMKKDTDLDALREESRYKKILEASEKGK